MTLAVKVIILMVIRSVSPMPDQMQETPGSPAGHPLDGSLKESDEEHLPWELVGEYVQDFDITAEDYAEEELQDARDPPMLTENLCQIFLSNENALEDLMLHHPHNTTVQNRSRRCFRSRWNVESMCRRRYIRYKASRYCCPVTETSPVLSTRGSLLRCRCPLDD